MKLPIRILLASGMLATGVITASAQSNSITVQVNTPGVAVSPNLFGIFFEEINFGGDGGLYAEMVRNRSFAASTTPVFWTLVTNGVATGAMAIDYTQPLTSNAPASLRLTKQSGAGGIGAANSGTSACPSKMAPLKFKHVRSRFEWFCRADFNSVAERKWSHQLRADFNQRPRFQFAKIHGGAQFDRHGHQRAARIEHHQHRRGLAG